MQIWPAIDLRNGNCVRLRQGDYRQETVFSSDPADMARKWVDQGADCLHLVDLDGARDGQLANGEAIAAILRAVDVPCELGGGIRDAESIEQLFSLGLSRLVIGTQILKRPEWFRQMCQRFPDRLVAGIDARQGQVATDGWLELSSMTAVDLARKLAGLPLAAIVYTDIARDGMMEGPNCEAMMEMSNSVSLPVIASGGVTVLADIERLAATGVAGCIIGRALYEGSLTVTEAVRVAGHATGRVVGDLNGRGSRPDS